MDEIRAIIDGQDFGAIGQAALDVGEPLFHISNDCERVLTKALHGDARDDLTLAIQFRDAAPFVGRQLNAGDIAQQNRRALIRFQDDALDVGYAFKVATPTHHELGFGQLNDAPANVHVR